MKQVILFTSIALSSIIAGCESQQPFADSLWPKSMNAATDVTASTIINSDSYTKTTAFDGPLQKLPAAPQDDWHMGDWHFRAEKTSPFVQLIVHYWRSDWAFLESAHDSEGTELTFAKIDSNVDGAATIHEYVAVMLTRAYVDAHRSNGIDLRIDGRHGSALVVVPPSYIEGFLSAIDAHAM